MSTILDTSEFIGRIEQLEDIQDTSLIFDFQFDKNNGANGAIGAVFRACNDVFALTIEQNRVTIANHAIIIDKPIELQEGKEYTVECGVKMDYMFRHFLLYVIIKNTTEVPQAFYDAFKSEDHPNEQ